MRKQPRNEMNLYQAIGINVSSHLNGVEVRNFLELKKERDFVRIVNCIHLRTLRNILKVVVDRERGKFCQQTLVKVCSFRKEE